MNFTAFKLRSRHQQSPHFFLFSCSPPDQIQSKETHAEASAGNHQQQLLMGNLMTLKWDQERSESGADNIYNRKGKKITALSQNKKQPELGTVRNSIKQKLWSPQRADTHHSPETSLPSLTGNTGEVMRLQPTPVLSNKQWTRRASLHLYLQHLQGMDCGCVVKTWSKTT